MSSSARASAAPAPPVERPVFAVPRSDSLVGRLTRLNLLVLSLSLLLCFVLIGGSSWLAVRDRQGRAAELGASVLANSLAPMLVFEDQSMARSEVDAFAQRRELVEVQVLDAKGRVFGQWLAPGVAASARVLAPPFETLVASHETDISELRVWAPVRFKNETVGALLVRESLHGLNVAAFQLLMLSVALIALSILIAARVLRLVQRRALSPLLALSRLAEQVSRDQDYSLRAPIQRGDEVGRLSERFNEMLKRIEVWQADLQQQLRSEQAAGQQMQQLAHRDSLTGLPNRLFFQSELQRQVSQALASRGRMALMFIDLDNFKRVNDSLGHDAGDEVLCEVSRRMSQVLRGSDVLCRLGGDEFALILPAVTDSADVEQLALRVIKAVREPMRIKGELVPVGATVGLGFCPEDAQDASELLGKADIAMYAAKKAGKNTYRKAGDAH